MQFTAEDLCSFLNGKLEGNPSVKIFKPAKIEEAIEGDLSFIANPKYLHFAYTTKASILIVTDHFVFDQPVHATIIRVNDAYASIAILLDQYKKLQTQNIPKQISSLADISPKAKIHHDVSIQAFCVISENAEIYENVVIYPQVYIGKNVHIGSNTVLFPGVIILDDCIVGNHCVIHANSVIGSDGFGFAIQEDKTYKKIAQTGNVSIGNYVEIGSNTTIDRATLGSTLIKDGVKIDNLVQIAHNVEIGENTVIAAQSGIAGSTKIGKNCILGGQVGVVGHVQIADGTKVNAQSGVNKDIKTENTSITGSPAFAFAQNMRSQVIYKRLPEMMQKIIDLEKQFAAFKIEPIE